MNDLFDVDEAATPLTPDEIEGLIPSHVTLRSELNELEQKGIIAAERWILSKRPKDLLSQAFLKTVHRHMFKSVWRWAGQYRKTDRNIGVKVCQIETELQKLLDDTQYWIDHKTYLADEIAIRFHHRLVQIHPFPNGNGRHARLCADVLIVKLGGPRFSWGQDNIVSINKTRSDYITSLRQADNNIVPLLNFARS